MCVCNSYGSGYTRDRVFSVINYIFIMFELINLESNNDD